MKSTERIKFETDEKIRLENIQHKNYLEKLKKEYEQDKEILELEYRNQLKIAENLALNIKLRELVREEEKTSKEPDNQIYGEN